MQPVDFFRSRIDAMINLHDPLAVLANRLPWSQFEAAVAAKFEHQDRAGQVLQGEDMFGTTQTVIGGGRSNAGRPKLAIRLMASLLYLKNSFNLSDEELVLRWSENILWQYFSGLDYYEHRLPCDATQIGRFRRALGEDGLELLLKATIDTAVAIDAVKPKDLERVIADTTVQEKAIAHPTDSRLLEIARHKVVSAAKRSGIPLKQTFAKEGKALRWKAGGYAHAKQFRRLQRVLKRQRTVLGVVIREVQRKTQCADFAPAHPKAISDLTLWLERATRIQTQRRSDKNKLYALHAPEVECIGKGKARKPYEFGVKSAIVVSHEHGLMLGARTFPGNPYDGHILSAVLEQAANLTQDIAVKLKHIVVDLGFRGVDADNPDKEIIHRGKFKSLSKLQKAWLKRRTAVEPAIGHLKSDHRMDRCWLQGALGDALHAISCAAGYNLRWLMRAIVRLGIRPLFLRLLRCALLRPFTAPTAIGSQTSIRTHWLSNLIEGERTEKTRFSSIPIGRFVMNEFCRADYLDRGLKVHDENWAAH
jgi:IS5 family transposase